MALLAPPPTPTAEWIYEAGSAPRGLRVDGTVHDGHHAIGLFLDAPVPGRGGHGRRRNPRSEEQKPLLIFTSAATAKRFIRILTKLQDCPTHLETGLNPLTTTTQISDPDERDTMQLITRWTGLYDADTRLRSFEPRKHVHKDLTIVRPRLEIHTDWLGDTFTLREPAAQNPRRLGTFLSPVAALIFRRELSLALSDEPRDSGVDPLALFFSHQQMLPQGYWKNTRDQVLRLIEPVAFNVSYLVAGDLTAGESLDVVGTYHGSATDQEAKDSQRAFTTVLDDIVHADFFDLTDPSDAVLLDSPHDTDLFHEVDDEFSFRVGTVVGAELFITQVWCGADDDTWILQAHHGRSRELLTVDLGSIHKPPTLLNHLVTFLLNTRAAQQYLEHTGDLRRLSRVEPALGAAA